MNDNLSHGYKPLPGRRSTALIHRWRPSAPRTRPNHSPISDFRIFLGLAGNGQAIELEADLGFLHD